jgi:general secretion pathway protein I
VTRRPRNEVSESGFTLIEVLVAFFIAALALTSALRVLGEGSRWARRGPDAAAELEEAASVMDTLVAMPKLHPGEQDGSFADGRHWRAQVTDVTGAVLRTSAGRLLRIDLYAQGNGAPLLVTLATGTASR